MDMQDDLTLMQQHLEKVAKEKLYDNNALMAYTYNDGQAESGYYSPDEVNLGDCIQALAAKQFMPEADTYIDRDRLGLYQGKPVNMIMNAWYRLWRKNRIFAPQIHPLMVSMHLNNLQDIDEEVLAYYKAHEPIGCRDLATRDFLQNKGIKAYFSGCMTLTLGETYRVADDQRENVIYFVHYRLGQNRKIDNEIKKILQAYPDYKILYRTQHAPMDMACRTRIQEAESLLREYARARLVITSKIHCALPCLALGTPVVFVTPGFCKDRFKGLISFFNHIGKNENDIFTCNVVKDAQGRVLNKTEHLRYAEYLKKLCLAFMHLKEMPQKKKAENYVSQLQSDAAPYKKAFRAIEFQRKENRRKIILFGCICIKYKKKAA